MKDQELTLSTRLTCLKYSFKSRKREKWTDEEILDGFDELIILSKELESQLKEMDNKQINDRQWLEWAFNQIDPDTVEDYDTYDKLNQYLINF